MNFHRTEKLLEKYFDGNTSLEDEKFLKEFFKGKEIPAHLSSLKEPFNYFLNENKKEFLDENFDHELLTKIEQQEKQEKKHSRRRLLYYISGIAASILIIISIFTNLDPFTSRLKDTFDNPQTAYEETKRALLMVSEALNRGVKPIDNISKFEDGMEQISKMKSLGTGMSEFEKISKFYDTQQKIINK